MLGETSTLCSDYSCLGTTDICSPPQKRKTFQDGFTIWHPKRQTSKGELVVFSLWTSKCKKLVLTPSGVGNLHQAQHCSSSAAEPHVTPKWKHQCQSQRGTVSGLPFPPQTASAGTLRAATGMGPENTKCVNLKINSMTTVVPRSRCVSSDFSEEGAMSRLERRNVAVWL